jgi:hypothetical protein
MYLLYLDESGDTGNWQQQNNFVIGGLAVYEFRLRALEEKLRSIQRRYFPNISIPIVFHATDIHSGNKIFRKFDKPIREQLLLDLYNIINSNYSPNVVIFGACISIDAAQNPFSDRNCIFEEVISGFNSFLVENYRQQQEEGTGRAGNKGLIIIDRNREEQYKQLIDTFKEQGTKYGYLRNIVDIPYFARSKDTPMLQLADLCSYALFRHYEKQDDTYLKIISDKIYVNASGKMFGLKHLTTNNDCLCPACTNNKEDYHRLSLH